MTTFTDVSAALDEAIFVAEETQAPQCIVGRYRKIEVVSYDEAIKAGLVIHETLMPSARWEAA